MKAIIFLLAFAWVINANAQNKTFTAANCQWMIPDICVHHFSTADTVMSGKYFFIKRGSLQKFVPDGWRVPTLDEIKKLINSLEGEPNSTGGKTADSAYLSGIIPFRLDGIYFSSVKRIIGVNSMTAFYTATDTLWRFDSTGLQPAQTALHIYKNGAGKFNIEPTYNRLSRGEIFCQMMLVRKEES